MNKKLIVAGIFCFFYMTIEPSLGWKTHNPYALPKQSESSPVLPSYAATVSRSEQQVQETRDVICQPFSGITIGQSQTIPQGVATSNITFSPQLMVAISLFEHQRLKSLEGMNQVLLLERNRLMVLMCCMQRESDQLKEQKQQLEARQVKNQAFLAHFQKLYTELEGIISEINSSFGRTAKLQEENRSLKDVNEQLRQQLEALKTLKI